MLQLSSTAGAVRLAKLWQRHSNSMPGMSASLACGSKAGNLEPHFAVHLLCPVQYGDSPLLLSRNLAAVPPSEYSRGLVDLPQPKADMGDHGAWFVAFIFESAHGSVEQLLALLQVSLDALKQQLHGDL